MGRQERIRLAEDGISMRGGQKGSRVESKNCRGRGAGRQQGAACRTPATWWYRAPTGGGPQKSYKKGRDRVNGGRAGGTGQGGR